jgi:hypothetical protein
MKTPQQLRDARQKLIKHVVKLGIIPKKRAEVMSSEYLARHIKEMKEQENV